jgi:LCP family protein required for cell wall assembly
MLFLGTVAGYIVNSPIIASMIHQKITRRSPQDVFGKDNLTLLILGCDEDFSQGGKKVLRSRARSDMILIVRLDFRYKRISGVSIPRDTLAELPGYHRQRINAYHAIGGNDLSKRVVEHVLGITIDRVMSINYDAFQDMINLVGGVEVYVPKKMDWDDHAGGLFIHLKPGRQILDGYNAMCFVRFRHSDTDFDRQKRQKDLMLAFKDKLLQKPTLVNQVSEKAMDMLERELTVNEVVAIALFAQKTSGDNIKMGMVPVVPGQRYDLILDEAKLPDTLRKFYLLDPPKKKSDTQ